MQAAHVNIDKLEGELIGHFLHLSNNWDPDAHSVCIVSDKWLTEVQTIA